MHIVTMMQPSFQECTWINLLNLHTISRVNLPGAFLRGGTRFGLNPLQAPRVGKNNNRQQKNPKKKKSTSRMKAISNYVPALRIMQQDKTAANPNPPKTNQHEENCYKVDGTSRITTESTAAESILCANLCWQQWLINEHVSKKCS